MNRATHYGSSNLSVVATCALVALGGCTPAAVRDVTLTPAPVQGESFMTLEQVVPYLEGVDPATLDVEALGRVALIGGREVDSFAAVLSLHEYPDLMYLDVWFYNRSEQAVELSPQMVTLLDGNRTQLRYLEPHEAANLMLAMRRDIPSYQPKRAYEVETYDYGTYVTSTLRQVDAEPLAALGYAIGSMISSSRNSALSNAAAIIYAEGLVPATSVAPDAALRFGIQWLKPVDRPYPLELRIPELGYRVSFEPPD